jgi:hypothetical protein
MEIIEVGHVNQFIDKPNAEQPQFHEPSQCKALIMAFAGGCETGSRD